VSELQHPHSRSFELVADVYERARPEYPPEAVAWIAAELGLREGRTVLDLGAGTGKLTRALAGTGANVIAVEPGEAMLAQLRQAVPGVEALHGAAEEIPLADSSVDAIAIGQAFHWFRHDEAVPELHRVLRGGGGVALLWNSRDQESAVQRQVHDLIAPFVPRGRPPAGDSARHLAESDLFGPVEERRFRFVQHLDADGLVERINSISFVAAASEERRVALDQRLRDLVAASGGVVAFPYVTDAYVSRALRRCLGGAGQSSRGLGPRDRL
jgi:ubiquinone/menaquinone biosynthesis C-methylase UbiE